MQITVKASRIASTGESAKGKWTLVAVVSEDGTEYTTFDTKATHLGQGAVVDIGEPVIKQGKVSFKEVVKVISEGTVLSPGNGRPGMTPELWAEKDRLERWSRECNTCFMGIMEYSKGVVMEATPLEGSKIVKVYNAALDWAMTHFTSPSQGEVTKEKAEVKKTEEDIFPLEFKNRGELLNKVTKELKFSTRDICAFLEIGSVEEITDYAKAWADLTAKKPIKAEEQKADSSGQIAPEDLPFS